MSQTAAGVGFSVQQCHLGLRIFPVLHFGMLGLLAFPPCACALSSQDCCHCSSLIDFQNIYIYIYIYVYIHTYTLFFKAGKIQKGQQQGALLHDCLLQQRAEAFLEATQKLMSHSQNMDHTATPSFEQEWEREFLSFQVFVVGDGSDGAGNGLGSQPKGHHK